MKPVDLHHGAASEVGHVRKVNEDSFLVAPPVFVVADGMGGHSGGDVASRIVVEEFARLAEEGYDPRRGAEHVAGTFSRAQARILDYADGAARRAPALARRHHVRRGGAGGGSEDDPSWLLVNLGDSRIYRFNDGELDQVSVDHSVVQELIDAGRDHRRSRRRPTPSATSSPGPSAAPRVSGPTSSCCRSPAAERLLLCSDGITGMIDDDDDRRHPRPRPRSARRRRRARAGRPRRRRTRQRDRRRRRCGGIGPR